MNTKNTVARLIRFLLITLTLFTSCGKNKSDIGGNGSTDVSSIVTASSLSTTSSIITPVPATRIVSFAPSITEILYELGLGDRVCGVTRFCNYPPEVAQKEKIGGQADRNYEAVVRLKPDLAVILKEQRDMAAFFDKYAIRYVTVGSDSVDEILESIQVVADACSVTEKGKTVVGDLRERIGLTVAAPDKSVNDRPKVLLCVSRDGMGTGTVGRCFVAGAAAFYDRLIDAAGGINVMKGVKQAYPAITAEAVITMAPDVIIDISMSYSDNHQQRQKNCDDWKALKSVPAVKNDRVRCMAGDYLMIPGPRLGLILEDFKDAVRQR